MITPVWIVLGISLLTMLAYCRSRLRPASVSMALFLIAWTLLGAHGWISVLIVWLVYAFVVTTALNTTLRKRWLTSPALRWFRKTLPELSDTERTALNAGTVGWEAELFSGIPDWQQLERLPPPRLSAAEQAFIDGPLQTLLDNMVTSGHDNATTTPVPLHETLWRQLRTDGFFGLAIPAEFGGKDFSAHARSCILAKVATAPGGMTLGPIIAAPNALGPAQLLLICGTKQQKAHYLPRLARGDEIPCFAVTSDRAGTDVAALADEGIICRYEVNGATRLGMRLNWHKRHITLGPAATLMALAVRLRDPDQLLGVATDLGITCVLAATDAPGVDNSVRQQPIGAAFPYGSSSGRDVLLPLDAIIGGTDMIGQGWQLLMEHLPGGRAISMPSAAAGQCTSSARLAGAYARVRHQFGRPIGAFDGVQEVLARMSGHAYVAEAMRRTVANTIDLGGRPAIAAAIAKYHGTTRAQQTVIDGMTLLAGKAVCAGPDNPIAEHYAAAPLAAISDGTNLFTRSMLIPGQGGIQCHPFLQAEIKAAAHPDPERALAAFDAVFRAHVGHLLTVAARSLLLGLSDGRMSRAGQHAATRRYQQRVNRYSAALALLADIAMAVLGDNLRHRENLSGRLGDVLSQLYIASAVIQRYNDDGAHQTDFHVVQWVCEDCFATIEQQLARILRYLPRRPVAWIARLLIFPFGRHADGPSDNCGHRVATVMQNPGAARERLLPLYYSRPDAQHGMALFDAAMEATVDTAALRKRLRRAIRRGDLSGPTPADCVDEAHSAGLLDTAEHKQLRKAYALHDAVIQVDSINEQTGIFRDLQTAELP